jgi:phage I-like protein
MPFAGFEDFDACVVHMEGEGYSSDVAHRICGKLQAEEETRAADDEDAPLKNTGEMQIGDAAEMPGKMPTEFRIFRYGWNESTKGPVLFDQRSAASVMAAWRRHGADIMIDLEHLSLQTESAAFDPDARAWCKLEVRNGELWATDVKWTPDGTERLTNKTQRYYSPAFYTDPNLRVTELLNIALCAMPATNQLTPLVAATRRNGKNMNEEQMSKLRALFGLNEDASVQDMIAALSAMSAEQVLGAVLAAIDKPPGGQDDADPADPKTDPEAPQPPSDDEGADELDAESAPDGEDEGDDNEFASDDEEDDRAAEAYAVLREELGCDDPDTIRASIKALRLHKQSSGNTSVRIAQLEAQIEQRDVRELVQANRKKIPPSLEKWALKQSLKALKAFIEEAPDVVPLEKVEPPEIKEINESVELTEAELMVCAKTGQDPLKLAEHKRKMKKSA